MLPPGTHLLPAGKGQAEVPKRLEITRLVATGLTAEGAIEQTRKHVHNDALVVPSVVVPRLARGSANEARVSQTK